MGIKQVLSRHAHPGNELHRTNDRTLRRECLDHLIVFQRTSLYRQFNRSLAITIELARICPAKGRAGTAAGSNRPKRTNHFASGGGPAFTIVTSVEVA